jgi:hypothetical protein
MTLALALSLAACGHSTRRLAVTGGLFGVGGGAAVGSATGLGTGTGALIGGLGALAWVPRQPTADDQPSPFRQSSA